MCMQTARTTIRLNPPLKKAAQQKALELNMSFQTLMEQALKNYLKHEAKKNADAIIFNTQGIGANLDNLTRDDIYAD